MSIPFGADDVRAWGRLAAIMHSACEHWHPSVWLRCQLLKTSPTVTLQRALEYAAHVPWCSEVLEKCGAEIISACEPNLDAKQFHPIHGDLWPGNMLKGASGLRAIDFSESGEGPRAMDLATAFRWMPWREDMMAADVLWRMWLSGYSEIREASDVELSSVPALACLQHLSWLVEEIANAGTIGSANGSWYIEDHCSAIKAIMARARY